MNFLNKRYKKTARPYLLTGCLSIFLTSCAGPVYYSSSNEASLVGATIRLNQELSARAGARIYIQYGRVMSYDDLTVQEPYCQFYVLRTRHELRQPLTIEPDIFIIQQVFRRRDLTAVESMQLAFEGIPYHHYLSQRTMSTYMEISSADQPDVIRLICSRWSDPYYWYHLSIEEIIETLGELAQFETF